MNIFFLHHDAKTCAEMHNDKHVVKMIIEYAQLLSTAHRVLDGTAHMGLSKSGRKQTRLSLPDDREHTLYVATHSNHPSAKWARHSLRNYEWLYEMWSHLLNEYTHRYGKVHSCDRLSSHLSKPPINIPIGDFCDPWRAMPEDVKIEKDSMASYRNYYIKAKYLMSRWTNRKPPQWFEEAIYKTYGDTLIVIEDKKRNKIITTPSYHADLRVSQ